MGNVQIRALEAADAEWVRAFFVEHWGGTEMVYSRGVHHCDQLPGFVALDGEEPIGVLTYAVSEGQYEIVSLDSLREGQGIGTMLMQAVEALARERHLQRIWLITTNDNLNALRFYQKRGYELVCIYRHAVEQARKIKPQIPLVGDEGIAIRDEIELEKVVGE